MFNNLTDPPEDPSRAMACETEFMTKFLASCKVEFFFG